MGLKTRNAQATQASTLLAFPLLFLTTTFLPMEFLKDWMQVAATINPTTYVLEAMRAALIDGWAWATIAWGFVAGIAVSGLTLMWALSVARSAIQRG
jgi:ABC-2 type transport system permease protein